MQLNGNQPGQAWETQVLGLTQRPERSVLVAYTSPAYGLKEAAGRGCIAIAKFGESAGNSLFGNSHLKDFMVFMANLLNNIAT